LKITVEHKSSPCFFGPHNESGGV